MEIISDNEKKLLEAKLKEKPFGQGMYAFLMFQIDYYSRVRNQLRLDYDTFIIVQVVTSHLLYILNKTSFENKASYPDIKKPKFIEIGVGDYTESNTRYLFETTSPQGIIFDVIDDFKAKVIENIKFILSIMQLHINMFQW